MKTEKYRSDILLIVGILFIGAIFGIYLLTSKKSGSTVQIRVSGKIQQTVSLDQDGVYEINGINGGTNTLIIKDGKAYMENASCPDGLCINMGEISRSGQSIVCLPNQVVVEVIDASDEQTNDTGVDVVTGGKQ